MINEDLINEYTSEFKRKQWNKYWKIVGSVHSTWLNTYMDEFYRRGAYPIDHQALANYYEDKYDIAIASFVAAYTINDDGDVIKSVEHIHGIIGDHPSAFFLNREFVHSTQKIMTLLDHLYNIRGYYGSIQTALMERIRVSGDLGSAIYHLLKDGGISISMQRCRKLAIRLATSEGMGLDVWRCFPPSQILPPEDEITAWYANGMFPKNSTFEFDDHALIINPDKPYIVMYEAMMMNLMRQADETTIRRYMYSLNKVFILCPTSTSNFTGKNQSLYLAKQPPVYNWDTQTLERNPLNPVNPAWVDYEVYKETEEYKQKLEERKKKREQDKLYKYRK